MSKYTAEQVEKEAEYQSHKFLTYTTVGMLRDYATLLRERESAKAAVTDEPRNEFPLLYDNLDALDERAAEQPNRIATARILTELRHQIGCVMTKLHGERAALKTVAPMLASARVPDGMIDRIDSAIQRIADGYALRRIPADPTDVDLVLAEVRSWITGQGWPPFWIHAAAPKPEKEE